MLAASAATADVLVLRSGERMECVVLRETQDKVYVDIGMGEMGLPLTRVVEIIREEAATNSARQATWEKQFAPPPPLPEAWQDLAGAYRQLAGRRTKAVHAVRAEQSTRKRLERLRDEERLQASRLDRLNREVERGPDSRTRKQYAEAVGKYNQAVARLNANRSQQAALTIRRETGSSATQSYLTSLARVTALHREQTQGLDTTELEEHVATWLGNVEKGLARYADDFERLQVPVTQRGGGLVVTAKVNDRGTGTFLVDTGASLVTLSAAAAERLGIRYQYGRMLRLTLADGSERQGHAVTLQALAVADAREEQVAAVVMEDPPAAGVDGLLGMSFLGNFMMSLDGADGDLVLRRFEPK